MAAAVNGSFATILLFLFPLLPLIYVLSPGISPSYPTTCTTLSPCISSYLSLSLELTAT